MESQGDNVTLDERKLANEFELKMRELAIAEKRLDYEKREERGKQWSDLKVTLVSVISAIVAALGTLATAYFGGFFDLEKTYATGNATISLTRLQFSNELIKSALSSTNPANSLMFYANIGLLDGLKSDTVKSYAEKENARVANKNSGPSLLPRFADTYTSNASLWITEENVRAIAPTAKNEIVTQFTTIGNYIISGFEINKNAQRLSMFVSQLAYESDGFTKIDEETANYSADSLMRLWPSRFDSKSAATYANKPEQTLNMVYANRIGNGDEQSGDGWRYRGRGLIWITGKANYEDMSRKIGIDLVKNPDLASDPSSALLIAAAYWYSRGLNDISDSGDIAAVTKRMVGGFSGMERRKKYFEAALAQFGR